jgi:hypothetical protein
MNRKLIKTLTLVCFILILIITFEWLYAEYTQKQLLSAVDAPAKQTPLEEMPTIDLNAKTEESYANLVNRPLFISGRKPIPEAEKNQDQTQAGGVNGNSFDWLLNGIYTTKKGLMALLSRTVAKIPTPSPNPTTAKPANDRYRKVIVGDNIEGWKVTEIHLNEIIVMQGGTPKKLLLRKPKAKEAQEQNSVPQPNSRAMPMRAHTPVPAPAPEPVPEPEPPAESQ